MTFTPLSRQRLPTVRAQILWAVNLSLAAGFGADDCGRRIRALFGASTTLIFSWDGPGAVPSLSNMCLSQCVVAHRSEDGIELWSQGQLGYTS